MTTTFAVDFNQPFNSFCAALAAAQQNNETIGRMQDEIEVIQRRLDKQWETLSDLAYQVEYLGIDRQAVCAALAVFLREWSVMQALALIVDLEKWVNPDDHDVQDEFREKLWMQHAWLESRLLLPFHRGRKERDAQSAQGSIEKLVQQNQELTQTVTVLLSQLKEQQKSTQKFVFDAHTDIRQVANNAHNDARTSLTVAIDAVKETKATASQFIQPALVEKAVERVEGRKPIRRVWFLIGIGVFAVAALAFVYIGLHLL